MKTGQNVVAVNNNGKIPIKIIQSDVIHLWINLGQTIKDN
jgi:hypothetical protein